VPTHEDHPWRRDEEAARLRRRPRRDELSAAYRRGLVTGAGGVCLLIGLVVELALHVHGG